jgi:hypothetical protein
MPNTDVTLPGISPRRDVRKPAAPDGGSERPFAVISIVLVVIRARLFNFRRSAVTFKKWHR